MAQHTSVIALNLELQCRRHHTDYIDMRRKSRHMTSPVILHMVHVSSTHHVVNGFAVRQRAEGNVCMPDALAVVGRVMQVQYQCLHVPKVLEERIVVGEHWEGQFLDGGCRQRTGSRQGARNRLQIDLNFATPPLEPGVRCGALTAGRGLARL
jgi:hypothetical protein